MNHSKLRWFLAGAATMLLIVAAFYFVAIMPLQRSIETSVDRIIAQRNAAMAENARLRAQQKQSEPQLLDDFVGDHNKVSSVPDPVTQ